ncbi:MAG: flagellar export protein FliJ [Clostridiales bacterium]|jgi:flagellar FliJ protein|nr:flagellar export protein FliJ [Clostridiales bacterium]
MAKFEFRLAGVLNLREKLEKQKEQEYAKALKKLEEERLKEKLLRDHKDVCVNTLAELMEDRLDPPEMVRYNDFIEVLKERISLQVLAVNTAAQKAEDKRLELVEAMKARKTLERLREQALEEFIEEEKHSEQKQVDQVVSYRYAKNI